METVYRLKTNIGYEEDGRGHTGYGVEVMNSKNSMIAAVEDVFLDMAKAAAFIALCNTVKLNPIHLSDVIQDMME